MNTYDDPEMIVKAQNYIKTFYDIMKHFLDIRTKELFTSKSILKKRMQKMMKKDPYDKLSFDIMELIKRI